MSLETYTLGQMADEVAGLVRDSSSPAREKIKTYLRHAYSQLANEYAWDELVGFETLGLRKRDDADSETLQAAGAFFPLPWSCARVLDVTLYSPQGSRLERIASQEMMERAGSYLNTTGCPQFWAVAGRTAQHATLAADSVLTVKSSSAGNDGVGVLQVVYKSATGQEGRTVNETVRGGDFSTGVDTNGTALAGWSVESVYFPPQWAGDITIEDALANVIVDLEGPEGGGEAASKPMQMSRQLGRVWPVPDLDYKAGISYQRRPRVLARDTDVPEIPVSPSLVQMAAGRFLMQANRPEEGLLMARGGERDAKMMAGSQGRQRIRVRTGGILNMTGTPNPRWRRGFG